MTEEREIESRGYEVGYLVRDEAAAREVSARAGQYGTVTAEGPLKRLSFAYLIKKEAAGYFGFVRVEALPDAIARLEKDFRMMPSVLRFLAVRAEPEKTLHSVVSQEEKPRRASRGTFHPEENMPGAGMLTNEALEKKIEEILQ